MTQERPKRSKEEARLDRLVIEATSDFSLAPDRPDRTYDVAKSDEEAERKSRRKRLILIVVIAVGAVGMVSFVTYGHLSRYMANRREAAALAEENNLLAALQEETRTEVGRLLSENKFPEAVGVLERAEQRGLPSDVWSTLMADVERGVVDQTTAEVTRLISENRFDGASDALELAMQNGLPRQTLVDLEKTIGKEALERQDGLLDQAEAAITANSPEIAGKHLEQARALKRYGMDAERFRDLKERVGQLEFERRSEACDRLLAASRKAAAEKDWDNALSLTDQARQAFSDSAATEEWAAELRGVIGGRLRILSKSEGATVCIEGREPTAVGKVANGLVPGRVEVVVSAEGCVPEIVEAEVPSYPEIGESTVELSPEAPGPLWATYLLAGQCAQQLAVDYYRREHEQADWVEAMVDRVQPCVPQASERKKNTESVRAAIKAFEAGRKRPVEALNELGAYTTAHPRALKTVLKKCRKRIRQRLGKIESGCSGCLARGGVPCSECDRRGKRKEQRTCPDCRGSGGKKHATCAGIAKVKCKRCKGKGEILKTSRVRLGDRTGTESARETCPVCNGEKTTVCRCKNGKIDCKACKGAGKRKRMGPCSPCEGRGAIPCDVCRSTGRRDMMDPVKRRAIERALNPRIRPDP